MEVAKGRLDSGPLEGNDTGTQHSGGWMQCPFNASILVLSVRLSDALMLALSIASRGHSHYCSAQILRS